MKSVLNSLEALPLGHLTRHPDVALAVGVAGIVAMMILPLPAPLLDGLLLINLAVSAIILVAVLLSDRPLAISTFPTLLLITTLFRLALNVSTTRMILGRGTAGEVVHAFGTFVLGGDIVVGMVIFLVITLVQFLVIAKGAERVAEVGARFTLDAMPGKQMSIDAAVRSGTITEEEGQERRDDLGRESQFYGAMDGAMKFIKGDVIAGMVITAINLIAGLVIGVLRNKMSLDEAAQVYSVLSVGDGLVAQLPALLITLSAAVLTTRVGSKEPKTSLGGNLQTELLSNPKVLGIVAGLIALLGFIPGIPMVICLIIAALMGIAAKSVAVLKESTKVEEAAQGGDRQKKIEARTKQAKAQRAQLDDLAASVAPVGIDLDPHLSEALGFVAGADENATELISQMIPQLRDALYLETGVRFPGVRVRSMVPGLARGACVLRIKDVPVAEEEIPLDKALAIELPERLSRMGMEVEAAVHPLNGIGVSWIDSEDVEAANSAGVATWSAAGVIALHLARILRKHAKSFIGLQETSELIDRVNKVYPALVKEVVPKIIGVSQLSDILKRLVDEGVSVRDLKTILEALAELGGQENDPIALTEHVRAALQLQIAHAYAGKSARLPVMLLDPIVEDTIRGSIARMPGGAYLALEPEIRRTLLASIKRALQPVILAGVRPVILTDVEIRRFVRKLLEDELSDIAVLSFQELPAQLTVQPLGRVSVRGDLAIAA